MITENQPAPESDSPTHHPTLEKGLRWHQLAGQFLHPRNTTQLSFLIVQAIPVLMVVVSYVQSVGQWWWMPFGILFLLLPAGFIMRQVTKKTATLSFTAFTPWDASWGIVEVDLPKTAAERERDKTFFAKFLPIFPLLLIEAIILAVVMMGGKSGDAEEFPALVRWLIVVAVTWTVIYFGANLLRKWSPKHTVAMMFKGSVTGLIFAPFTVMMLMFLFGVIDGLIKLFFGGSGQS